MGQELLKDLGLENVLVLDRRDELSEADVLYSFALDELLCRSTGKGGPSICHIWRHPRGFVMGLRDSRLPEAASAEQELQSAGWATAVRNSGGAAVPLDLGVINISLIMPKPSVESFHFHDDFERMYGLIRHALQETGCQVDKGEIRGAYCPGDFDLSINGYKFCGIAQRRQTHAFIVQAFIITEGSGQERARFVRKFYDQAVVGADSKDYPIVDADSTASLEQLTGLGPDAGEVFVESVKRIIRSLQTEAGIIDAEAKMAMPSQEQIRSMAEVMRARYAIQA
ncbi:lipoate--protein ligase family protein [Paenibacillus sp. LHD-38]|uniref:lipoate--protein ligase family protein n=1 Tax=Paenibacillus sp. LHD-38 TaxID=3072143 RepID=UPI00280CE443|nr:lipoate--protein ligase family protein [Paenibacillus sp. LHD-38]MDQ8738255.1 lipoate--protein ligase family protein [Paenibacillus sp. LHD-38]